MRKKKRKRTERTCTYDRLKAPSSSWTICQESKTHGKSRSTDWLGWSVDPFFRPVSTWYKIVLFFILYNDTLWILYKKTHSWTCFIVGGRVVKGPVSSSSATWSQSNFALSWSDLGLTLILLLGGALWWPSSLPTVATFWVDAVINCYHMFTSKCTQFLKRDLRFTVPRKEARSPRWAYGIIFNGK